MRVRRLARPGEWVLDLHPHITVVTGLDEQRRAAVLDAVTEAVQGRVTGVAGLVEAHGVLLDLDTTSLGLLELDRAGVDGVVVTAADLPDAGASPLGHRLRSAERRLEHRGEEAVRLRTELALQESFDPAPVRAALDRARAEGTGGLVPSTEAVALAERLERSNHELAEIGDVEVPPASELDAAARRVEDAVAEYQRLEEASREPRLSEAARVEIDRCHAELMDAEEDLDRRFGKGRAQRRSEDARARFDEALQRSGFHSWTDYLTLWSAPARDLAASAALAEARAERADAEAEQQELQARVDATIRRTSLLEDRAAVRSRARQLLTRAAREPDGQPDEGSPAEVLPEDEELLSWLVELRVPVERHDTIRALTDALERVGLAVAGLDLDIDDLEQLAADWLDEHERAGEHRARLAADLDTATEEVAALRRDVGETGGTTPVAEEVEWYLLSWLAAQRNVGFAGSVPLVFDRTLDGIADAHLGHLLDRIAAMAGPVQVVYLTDDPRFRAWAERAGSSLADVVTIDDRSETDATC